MVLDESSYLQLELLIQSNLSKRGCLPEARHLKYILVDSFIELKIDLLRYPYALLPKWFCKIADINIAKFPNYRHKLP